VDRTERFYLIDRLLRDRGCLSLLALMHELGTSRATLLRATPFSVWRCSGPLFAAILLPERAISIF
jgi:hypothetical protein